MLTNELEEWTEEELKRQEQSLTSNNRKKVIEQKVGVKIEKKKDIVANLLCLHRETIEKDGYTVCIKCNTKWKVKNNDRKR